MLSRRRRRAGINGRGCKIAPDRRHIILIGICPGLGNALFDIIDILLKLFCLVGFQYGADLTEGFLVKRLDLRLDLLL